MSLAWPDILEPDNGGFAAVAGKPGRVALQADLTDRYVLVPVSDQHVHTYLWQLSQEDVLLKLSCQGPNHGRHIVGIPVVTATPACCLPAACLVRAGTRLAPV